MAEIDFPPGNQTPFFDPLTGDRWDFINGSWVRSFDYVEEAPNDSVSYVRKNSGWLADPIQSDAAADDIYYARRNQAWEALASNMGPVAPANDGLLYGIRDGGWDLIPNDDLTSNYYDKAASDARFASITHTHLLADITDAGALAAQADTGVDGVSYVRKDNAWVDMASVLPAVQTISNSITIIDPVAEDDAALFFTPVAITASMVKAAAIGDGTGTSGTVNFNIYFADTADGSGGNVGQIFTDNQSCQSGAGDETFTIDTAAIPANSWVWVVLTDDPVDTKFFHITLVYSEA
jgi:hypothetical protein